MDRITRDDLKALIEQRGEFLASVYIPTVRSGDQTEKNPIKFKNAIQELERRFEQLEAHKDDVNKFLQPLRDLQEDHRFWQFQSDGFALFNSGEYLAHYRVPVNVDDLVVLTDHFHLKPMFKLLSEDNLFYILALAQGSAKLYRCTHWSIEEVEVKDMPKSLDDHTRFDHEQMTVRGQEGASSAASVYYGQGRASDKELEVLRNYFSAIDSALQDFLDNHSRPLVLATVSEHVPLYKDVNKAFTVLEDHIAGNPEHEKEKDLHARAWAIVEPHFNQTRKQAREQFHEQLGTGTASQDLDDIIPAAQDGKVGTLWVADDQRVWGFYHPDERKVERRDEGRELLDEDLLDYAARMTLLNSGEVHVLPAEEIPGDGPIAALYRY